MRTAHPWLLAALLLASSPALAQDADGEGDADAEAEQGDEPETPPYMVKVQSGIRLIVQKDADGALAALREAVELDPSKSQAHYYIGTAQRQKGELQPAVESFRAAAQRAQAAGQPGRQARALFAVAETLERVATAAEVEVVEGENTAGVNREGLEKAREAWQQGMGLAQGGQGLVNPEIVRARIQAVDRVLEQDRSYADVRKKIAQREKEKQEEEESDD